MNPNSLPSGSGEANDVRGGESCCCGNPNRIGWTHRSGWCNEGGDHFPQLSPPSLHDAALFALSELRRFDKEAERHGMGWQKSAIKVLQSALSQRALNPCPQGVAAK